MFDTVDTDAVFAKLQTTEPTETPAVQPSEPATVQVQSTEPTGETSTPPAQQATPAQEPVQKSQEDVRIPKARLDHEIAQRKQVQADLVKAQKELEQLRKSTSADKDLDFLGLNEANDLEKKIQGLEAWKQELEWNQQVTSARSELDTAVQSIQKEYPKVPDKVLYSAVIQNPNVDLWAVAEEYNTWVQGIRAEALSEAGITQNTPARPAAVPRPNGTSTPMQSSAQNQGTPSTMEEAAARTLALFGG